MEINFGFNVGDVVRHRLDTTSFMDMVILDRLYHEYAHGYDIVYRCRSSYQSSHYTEEELVGVKEKDDVYTRNIKT